jgi:hypothetical protein
MENKSMIVEESNLIIPPIHEAEGDLNFNAIFFISFSSLRNHEFSS